MKAAAVFVPGFVGIVVGGISIFDSAAFVAVIIVGALCWAIADAERTERLARLIEVTRDRGVPDSVVKIMELRRSQSTKQR
jgi:hypothetical protein